MAGINKMLETALILRGEGDLHGAARVYSQIAYELRNEHRELISSSSPKIPRNTRIEDMGGFGMTTSVMNKLMADGCETWSDVLKQTSHQLLCIPNFGRKNLEEVGQLRARTEEGEQ